MSLAYNRNDIVYNEFFSDKKKNTLASYATLFVTLNSL